LSEFYPLSCGGQVTVSVAIILSGADLVGCGVVQAQGKTSTSSLPVQVVTLWESHSPALPAGKSMQALVDQFNRTHHRIHVDLTVTKASRKALAALPVGNAPVLAEISHYDGNYIKAHAVKSLNPYIGHGLSLSVTQSIYPDIWHNGEVNGRLLRQQDETMETKAHIVWRC
jgi:ABC-type glycerol-3-phosphate transport system substrate-binding protein